LRDADVVYLEKLPSRRSVSTPATVGDRLPANCTAVGKALLAFSDEKSAAYALDGPLRRRTAHSLNTPDEIRRQLASVKAAGYATDREEAAPGLACVAVPVLVGDRAVAALSVAFQSSAGSGEVLLNPLRQAAAAISKAPAMRDFAASALTATTG
jgi:DNA-binding IclR family transcriptional regulator